MPSRQWRKNKSAQILRGGVDELNIISRLRQQVEKYTFRLDGEDVHITMSFGVAELSPEDEDHTEIIKNADYVMYKAKNSGRNRVIVYPSGEDQV